MATSALTAPRAAAQSGSGQRVAAQRAVVAQAAAQGRSPRPSFSAPRKPRQPSVSSAAMAGSMSLPSSYLTDVPESYSIADSEALKDFATLQTMMDEIQKNITARQDKISLLTEEVKLLRGRMGMAESRIGGGSYYGSNGSDAQAGLILSKLGGADASMNGAAGVDASVLQSLLTDKALQGSAASYALAVAAIVFTGGVAAPVVEEKLGLGAAAYYDYVASQDLPITLAEVDPVTSAVSGGAVGVLTAQLLAEAKMRQQRRM